MRNYAASAPGKIIIMGEHAVVYGKPAWLAAINLRCRTTLVPRSDQVVEITSKQLQFHEATSLDDILRFTQQSRAVWEQFQQTNDPKILRAAAPREADLIPIAIGEALLHLDEVPRQGFSLVVDSEVPLGLGLGSSAAVATSVVMCVSKFLGTTPDKARLTTIIHEVEKKKHGFPSGGDVAAAVYGRMIWYRRETEFLKCISPLEDIDMGMLRNCVLIPTGRPTGSTGDAVSFVREQYQERPAETQLLFDQIETLTKDGLIALKRHDMAGLIHAINGCGDHLVQLGIVPQFAQAIIADIRQAGGGAKISGKGGISGKAAGIILAVHPEPQRIVAVAKKYDLPYWEIKVGVEGVA
ncbi:MAG: hypothetical protein H0X37_08565 [Herpetosiphonaceae bacterium]|nr:hypothetical protein [Herpetosiphonaceae bacterium]